MSAFKQLKTTKVFLHCEGLLSDSKLSSNLSNSFLKNIVQAKAKSSHLNLSNLRIIESVPLIKVDEYEYGRRLNKLLDLKESKDFSFNQTNIILPQTYLQEQMISLSKKGTLLVCGHDETNIEICKKIGVSNFITMEEYTLLYPFLVPISGKNRTKFEAVKNLLLEQRGINIKSSETPHKIAGVFILQNPKVWEEHCQVK